LEIPSISNSFSEFKIVLSSRSIFQIYSEFKSICSPVEFIVQIDV
jgi:hypothetical protein